MASVFGSADDSNSGPTANRALDEVLINQQKQQETIKTGIPGFDENLGQGLPGGNIYLLTGNIGSNTEQFAQQILYSTLISKSKIAYYNVESSSTDVIQDMKVRKMNIQQYVDDGSWKFVRIIPQKTRKVLEALPEEPMEHRIYLEETLTPLMNNFYESAEEKRNTIIHLTALAKNYSHDELQNLLLYLKGIARRHGGIHFLMLTEEAIDTATTVSIKSLVDSVFEISTTYRGNELESIVAIPKIRNMVPRTRRVRLTERDTGLSTETIRRVQ